MNLIFEQQAQEDLQQLDRELARRIATKIRWYSVQENPLAFAKRLRGFDVYRFRVGDYRVIFSIQASQIVIRSIRHRSTVYR